MENKKMPEINLNATNNSLILLVGLTNELGNQLGMDTSNLIKKMAWMSYEDAVEAFKSFFDGYVQIINDEGL